MTTWHYIFEPGTYRLLLYQYLTHATYTPTVEDQLNPPKWRWSGFGCDWIACPWRTARLSPPDLALRLHRKNSPGGRLGGLARMAGEPCRASGHTEGQLRGSGCGGAWQASGLWRGYRRTQAMAAVRKYRPFADGSANASNRPFADLPGWYTVRKERVLPVENRRLGLAFGLMSQLREGRMSETRKLAAILVADIAGYSRLAGADEDRILARLRALRSDLIDPTIAVHHGRIVKRTGDGSLTEFRSVIDAVCCAIEVQNGLIERNAGVPPERRIEFRVGITSGRRRRGERRRSDGRRRQYRRAARRHLRAGWDLANSPSGRWMAWEGLALPDLDRSIRCWFVFEPYLDERGARRGVC